jgi:hypothetical protein
LSIPFSPNLNLPFFPTLNPLPFSPP